jgi:hypothetical protein
MTPTWFVFTLALALGGLVAWGCRTLPAEGWQFLAAVPVERAGDDRWTGVNLTWYGAFSATAYTLAAAMAVLLLAAAGVPLAATAALASAILAACVPASRFVARLVEKKKHGFTVGGAAFVGTLLAPWLAVAAHRLGPALGWSVPVFPSLAATALAYAYGEGVGRLACMSFGCCYGRPVDEAPALLRRVFGRAHFVFRGETKKIAYASGFEGRPVIPVQALTAGFYLAAALLGTLLYLEARWAAAFVLITVVTHGWRAASEVLRADWRGEGRVSAYQWMAIAGVAYGLAAAAVLPPGPTNPPDLGLGLRALWSPGVLLSLQLLWAAVFLYTGRSTVTAATLSFHVRSDRV